MKVLAVCFQASPARGSEFSVGWGWLSIIAKSHELCVITNDASKQDVENYVAANPEYQKIRFIFVPWNTSLSGTLLWPLVRRFRYSGWRRAAQKETSAVCANEHIDICHYVNAVGFLDVVPMWKTGVPFVWGPVGGLSYVSRRLFPLVGIRSRIFYALKNALRFVAIRCARIPRRSAHEAAAIVAATEQTRSAITRYWGVPSTTISEVGMAESNGAAEPVARKDGDTFRIAWVGRVHSGKAPSLLLDAVAGLGSDIDWQVDFIGDGPDRSQLEARAKEDGTHGRTRFHGWLPRESVSDTLRQCHAYVFTSIYDLTSNALIEAMSAGLPVICLSTQAAAAIVGDECGIVIDVLGKEQVIADLRDAISTLYGNEPQRIEYAKSAHARAQQYLWEHKAAQLQQVYSAV